MSKEEVHIKEIRSVLNQIKEIIFQTNSPLFFKKLFLYNKIGISSTTNSSNFEIFKPSLDGKDINWMEIRDWNKAYAEAPLGYYPIEISSPKQMEKRADIDTNSFMKVYENIYLLNSRKKRCFYDIENTLLDVKAKYGFIRNLNQRVSYKLEKLAEYNKRLIENKSMVNFLKNKMKLFGETLSTGLESNELKNINEKMNKIVLMKENNVTKRNKYKKKIIELNESLGENISSMSKDLQYLRFISEEMKYAAENKESYNKEILDLEGKGILTKIDSFSDDAEYSEESVKEDV